MASYSLQQFECDPEKARARQQCLDALLESFPDEKERMNLKVVHLTGPSRAEYEQVYKKAGISSGNVYGIEQDAKAYALVDNENKKADDKIVLCQEPIQQFLQREEAPFDVVSLDFDTTYNRALVQSLDALFDPHCPRISNKSMLYVNVQARRENTGFQNRLYFLQGFGTQIALSYLKDTYLTIMKALSEETAVAKTTEDLAKSLSGIKTCNYDLIASLFKGHINGLSKIINSIRTSLFFDVFIMSSTSLIRRTKTASLRKIMEDAGKGAESDFDRFIEFLEPLKKVFFLDTDDLRDTAKFALYFGLCPELIYRGFMLESSARRFSLITPAALSCNREYSWDIINWRRIPYISASKCPMEGQIFSLKRSSIQNKLMEKLSSSVDISNNSDFVLSLPKFLKRIEDIALSNYCGGRLVNRLFNAKNTEQTRTAVDALRRFRHGQEIVNLATRYPQETVETLNIIKESYINFLYESINNTGKIFRIASDIFNLALSPKEKARLQEAPQEELGNMLDKASQEAKRRTQSMIKGVKSVLCEEDKIAIRQLSDEGFSSIEIQDTLNGETSLQAVKAIISRHKNPLWKKSDRNYTANAPLIAIARDAGQPQET